MLFRSLMVCLASIALSDASAQMTKKEVRKAQWKGDMSASGVGFEFYSPAQEFQYNPVGQWTGVNMLFGVFQMGIGQGNVSVLPSLPQTDDYARASNFYLGASIPLPVLTLGKFRSYNNSFRMHPIANINFHRLRSYQNEDIDVKIFSLQGALGYRIRLPYSSIDFTFNASNGFWKNKEFSNSKLTGFTLYPMITLRWDGLLDKFKPTFLAVDAMSSKITGSSSYSTTTREKINGVDYRVTRTTTNYSVTTTPTKVMIQDIGTYRGIGPKITGNGIRSAAFKGGSLLAGVQGLYRHGYFAFGGTIEGGVIGHGSALEERKNKGTAEVGDNFYRRLDRSKNNGIGTYTAVNVMADNGMDLSSLKYGLFGFDVEYNDATSFTALTFGYSFGLNVIFDQRFVDPSMSNPFYDAMNAQNEAQFQRSNTHFEDPRNAKTGLMGGWFVSCDIGNASLRMQWYRYRTAPLANGLLYSVIWRFN